MEIQEKENNAFDEKINTNNNPTNNNKSKLSFLIITFIIVLSIFFILFFTVNEKKQSDLKKINAEKEQLQQTDKASNKQSDQLLMVEKTNDEKENTPSTEKVEEKETFDAERITRKIEDFININLINDSAYITIKEMAVEEYGLYKVRIDPGNGQLLDVYMTKDEKLIFPQTLNIQEIEEEKIEKENEIPADQDENLVKNDRPVVELFVMSHCPYGTQIEKGFLPVLNTLGNQIDFEIKFVDYAMHGKKEIIEQLNQYCIQKEENEKYLNYLKCFLEDGDYDNCIIKTEINISKLNTCVFETEKEFNLIANFNDKSTYKGNFPVFNIHKEDNVKYKVGGSPALVINSQQVSTKRDPKSLLATVCLYFDNPPDQCNIDLPSIPAAPGFGFDTKGNATEALCS